MTGSIVGLPLLIIALLGVATALQGTAREGTLERDLAAAPAADTAADPDDARWRQWVDMAGSRPPWEEASSTLVGRNSTQRQQRVAVLTSGTLKRYFMTHAADGLVQPMVEQGYSVDYYVALSAAAFDAWSGPSADGYLPVVSPTKDKFPEVRRMIKQTIERAGGRPVTIRLLEDVHLHKGEEEFVESGKWNGLDEHGKNARRSVMKMVKPLGLYLGRDMQEEEAKYGEYDFVIILKDDAIWLRPFDLNRLLSTPLTDVGPAPDGYVLRCDPGISTYSPPASTALTDYIFVLRRGVADPFYKMHSLILNGTLDDGATANFTARSRAARMRDKFRRSSNFEGFSKMVATFSNARMQRTPPDLIPMQRGGRIEVSGAAQTCLHKCCDSQARYMRVKLLHPTSVYPMCFNQQEPPPHTLKK